MPATSKAQQQAAGAALAAKKKGTTSGLKGASKAMAKMSKTELEKIASTKHKGLPKHVKESITMEEPMEGSHMNEAQVADNITFWVVEKPKSPTDNPMELYFETDPLGFANQIMGGLMPEEILGFYANEDEASNAAHDQVTAVMEAAKALEKKKEDVSGKLEGTIKQLQKEVNRCMDEGNDLKAQQMLERIAALREKHKMVEASKKEIKPTKDEE